jgi:hypothetical protein
MQILTSATTSINKNKLPASTKKIPFYAFQGSKVLDIGGGKFDNLKDFLKQEYNIDLFIYDKFNRTNEDNQRALHCEPSLIICNNVLNVIDSTDTIKDIAHLITSFNVPYIVQVYEGDKTNKGKQSKKDCYQRNELTKEYLQFFPTAKIQKGLINGGYLIL